MNVNGVTSSAAEYTAAAYKTKQEKEVPAKDSSVTEEVSYEKSTESAKKTDYKQNAELVAKLKADADKHTAQLKSLVEKMMLKQAGASDKYQSIWEFLASGDYTVDPEVAAQAKEDISEDGYWGVEQTSERIISFAKALTGGDPSKIAEMRKAFEKGFSEATKSWGNGFDPHYRMGQWNVYQTPDSLEKYHLPSFRVAVEQHTSSIMPYYAKPAAEKSAPQQVDGQEMPMEPRGFAYNRPFLQTLLREQMGYDGYLNSDTGIVHNMSWGVEPLDVPERIGYAVTHAGIDLISGLFDQKAGHEALSRSTNGYYDRNPVPEGFRKEDIVLTEEALDRAVTRTLTEMFALGLFENPYRDPEKAAQVIADPADAEQAKLAHRKSVVLLKNDGTLPLQAAGKTVYAACFHKNPEDAEKATAALRELLKEQVTLTEDYTQADVAILLLNPSSGAYFNATLGYLELDLCENKTVCDVDDQGRPAASIHQETTLSGVAQIAAIADAVHARGGKVITELNVTLAWQVGNVEPHCDAFLAGFDTDPAAVLDVIFGRFAPTGKLPLTLPRSDEVLSVNAEGVCISPNDVPGYDKDFYLPAHLKDENGKGYAYRDAVGNYYELDFGLRF